MIQSLPVPIRRSYDTGLARPFWTIRAMPVLMGEGPRQLRQPGPAWVGRFIAPGRPEAHFCLPIRR
jgi:hypothetical protein